MRDRMEVGIEQIDFLSNTCQKSFNKLQIQTDRILLHN